MYGKVARFSTVQYGKDGKPNVIPNAGSGFFYACENQAYFVTDRNYVIIEEKAFLPDSIIIHQNGIERQTEPIPSIGGMQVSLYDKNEKPAWRVLSGPEQDAKRMLISIPIPQDTAQGPTASAKTSFLATEQFPKEVYLDIVGDDGKPEIESGKGVSLSIPVTVGLSLADYFLYSDKSNEKDLQRKIEKQYEHPYQDYGYNGISQVIEVNFSIHRKGFAKDMIEMVLVLLEQNMDNLKELTDEQNLPGQSKELSTNQGDSRKESKVISKFLRTHSNLMKELAKIMEQFQDVLEPSIFDRMETMFKIMATGQNRLAGLLSLLKHESDYLIVKHLIRKILEQLGRNIAFTQ